MDMNKNEYKKYTAERSPKTPCLVNCLKAFVSGGAVCFIGQLFADLYALTDMSEKDIQTLVPVTLIFITAILTGFGLFDKIAHFAGAGVLVPITGFANAVVSPAIDTKNEGLISGVGTKIFSIAGPVILFGCLASAVYGVIYYIFTAVI